MIDFSLKKFNILFIAIPFLLIKFITSQEFNSNLNCKIILINQKIIYIIDNEENTNIYKYNENNPIGTYSLIKKNKSIIKISESDFLIFGLKENHDFCYQSFHLSDSASLDKNSCNRNDLLNLNGILQLDGKFISGTKIILSTRMNSEFIVYLFDFNNYKNTNFQIREDYNYKMNYIKDNIQCDSSDGINFFCIFSYYKSTEWKMFYLRGKFDDNGNENTGNICNNECFWGNIIKFDNLNNKYLLCYQKKLSSSLAIECQYYSYIDNKIVIDNTNEVERMVGESLLNKPLMLYTYENSIIIGYDLKSNTNIMSMLILCSFDFKIKIQSTLVSGSATSSISRVSIINTNSILYIIYEETEELGIKTTKIKSQAIKGCINDKSISLSNNQTINVDFKNGHETDTIFFSLDSNINLFRGNDEIISSNSFVILENNNKIFSFAKKEKSGVFQNYYCYANNEADGLYQFFSLICPISLTICNSACQTCISEKASTDENNLCTSCINDYYPLVDDSSNTDGYNCYNKLDPKVLNYYLYNNLFYKCNIACKTCNNDNSCKTCQDGYYFKASSNNIISINDLCYNSITSEYYLDYNVNIPHNGEIIKVVYKECYKSCYTCKGPGTFENNNCLTCKEGIKYPFKEDQCILNKQNCFENKKYWELNNNNIECISNCNKNIILYGDNRGQCVENCQNYIDPFSISTSYFTLTNCDGKNYCIPLHICFNGKFYYNITEYKCERKGECKIDVFNDTDPFEHDNDPIPTEPETTVIVTEEIYVPIEKDEKIDDINKRIRVFKIFTNYYNYTFYNSFDLSLIQDYIELFKREKQNHNNSDIYLITTTKYFNFTITIYPLDIEEFVYEQIFSPNNLGFANFTKTFTNFIDYEVDKNCLILIILMESHLANSSINDLNYYFYSFNEKKDNGDKNNEINIEKDNYLANKDSQLEISYPLYNYYDENSNINQRNSKTLVDNIKLMNNKYPNIEIYNLDDPFYNDICSLFTTDVNTDMTLNDRRNEYYVNISFCENNCFLIKVLNKELKNPKSLCSCKIKQKFTSSNQSGIKDNIPAITSYNIKSFFCIKEIFNKISISSNIIFWIFLIIFLFLIIMLIRWIFYGNKEIKRILGLYRINPNDSNLRISINSNEISEQVNKSKNNSMNKNNNNSHSKNINIKENYKDKNKNKKKEAFSKSLLLPDKKERKNENNEKDSQQIEYLSAPINPSFPPKRKEIKKISSIATKEEKDLVSNSDPSFFKASMINPNEKDNTDISFENYPYDNQIYVDNLLRERNILKDNYLQNPIEFEKFQKMQIMRNSLYSPEDFELKKYCNTYEDIYCPKNKNNKKKGINRKSGGGRKNQLVMQLLDGESLFDKQNDSNNNLSDNNEEKKFYNNKGENMDDKNNIYKNNNSSLFKEEKKFEGDEEFFFPDGVFGKDRENSLIDDDNNEILKKKSKNKNKNKSMSKNKNSKKMNNKNEEINKNNEEDSNNEKNKSDEDKDYEEDKNKEGVKKNKKKNENNFKKNNARNQLLNSFRRKSFQDDYNEEKKEGKYENKNEKMKTEYDIDAKNKIKSELKKIANGEDNSNSEGGIFNKNNNLIKSNYSNVLKLKTNKYKSKDKEKNKYKKNDLSKESNRRMMNFGEEEEFNGDMGIPISEGRKSYNNEEYLSDIIKDEKNSKDNKSDFEMFNNKIFSSSVSEFLDTEEKKPIKIEENFILYYWKYFQKREICLVSFRDRKDTIPYYVRWSNFVFCLIFILLLNCLFFFEKNVHKRYLNALNGNKNNIVYYFKNEYIISFCISLITIVFKMLIIKIILYKALKIKKEDKKMMSHNAEKGLSQNELEELQKKRNRFLIIYKIKLIAYFLIMMALNIFFAYICICYAGIFKNSISAFLFGFLFSFITSFILCALICLIIVSIYRISKKFKNRCLLSFYIVISTMY